MFQGVFKKLELAETATFLDQINPVLDGADFDAVETTVMVLDLPFYPGYRFVEISENTHYPPRKRFVICKNSQNLNEDEITVLNWTNAPVYKLNQDVPIALDENNVSEYIRFFFEYIRGKHGRFLITESVDDIRWKDDPPPQARKAIGKMLIPLSVQSIRDGNFYLHATMMFKDSLFKADVEVQPGGLVTLSNEELLVEDIPVQDDIFGQ
jgi:hypothetical protein